MIKDIHLKKDLNLVLTTGPLPSICYEFLREALEALSIKKGYKIYNHDCYTAFLKEIAGKENMSLQFDRYRKIRNRINYYGKEIEPKDAEKIKKEIFTLISEIRKFFK